MSFLNFDGRKIKVSVVEPETFEDEDYFVEVFIRKDFLQDIFVNFIIADEKNLPALVFPLTLREKQVLQYIASGKNNYQIARYLNVSIHTAKVHIHNIFNKLSVNDRTEAVVKAIKYKLIQI